MQMFDYRWFFLVLALLGGISLGVSAVCSARFDYRPSIRPAYGDTSWSAIDELEGL